jgi:hypothetical protein
LIEIAKALRKLDVGNVEWKLRLADPQFAEDLRAMRLAKTNKSVVVVVTRVNQTPFALLASR